MFKRNKKNDHRTSQSSAQFTAADFHVEIGAKTAPYFERFDILTKEIIKELKEEFDEVERKGGIGLKLDELFVLRYVLSEKGNKANILAAIRKGLKWRVDHLDLLRTLHLCTDGTKMLYVGVEGTELKRKFDFIQAHLATAFVDGQSSMPHPIFITRGKLNNLRTIMRKVDKQTLKLFSLLQVDLFFRLIDERTRETKQFVKVISVYDVKHFHPFSREFDVAFIRALAENSKHSEYLHPQQLGMRIFLNVPSTMLPVIKICRKLLTQRAKNKVRFCSGRNLQNRTDAGSACPFVKKHVLGDVLPGFLGGTAKCPASLDGYLG